jgi:hypothetical protein
MLSYRVCPYGSNAVFYFGGMIADIYLVNKDRGISGVELNSEESAYLKSTQP